MFMGLGACLGAAGQKQGYQNKQNADSSLSHVSSCQLIPFVGQPILSKYVFKRQSAERRVS